MPEFTVVYPDGAIKEQLNTSVNVLPSAQFAKDWYVPDPLAPS